MRSLGVVITTRLTSSAVILCASISVATASSMDWIGEPTHHFLIDACMISKRVPSSAVRRAGSGASPNAVNRLSRPENGSCTAEKPAATILAADTPLRAPMPPKSERLLHVLAVALPVGDAGQLLHGVREHVADALSAEFQKRGHR